MLGLEWRDVDQANRRIHVRRQVHNGRAAPLKDDESRVVPIVRPLAPVLAAWRPKTGGEGLLFRPRHPKRGGRPGQPATYVRPHTLHRHLEKALIQRRIAALTWYQATRHTFASQWVLGGGSIEKLAKIMGHSSVIVTERYAHLRPDLFREADYGLLDGADLVGRGRTEKIDGDPAGSGAIGYAAVTIDEEDTTAIHGTG